MLTEAQVDSYVSNNGYIASESDPQVGANTTDYVSKWDGTSLVESSIYDNGNVCIGTSIPDVITSYSRHYTKLYEVESWLRRRFDRLQWRL